jgi:hypothetical protein
MQRDIASQMIKVIRTEKKLRSGRLRQADPIAAWEQWLFTDLPFINEMCLILLVAIRHRVEREFDNPRRSCQRREHCSPQTISAKRDGPTEAANG